MSNLADYETLYYAKDFSKFLFVFKGIYSGIFAEYEVDTLDNNDEIIIANHDNLIEKIAEALDKKLLKINSDYLHVWIDLWRYEGRNPDNPDDHFKKIMQELEDLKKRTENNSLG